MVFVQSSAIKLNPSTTDTLETEYEGVHQRSFLSSWYVPLGQVYERYHRQTWPADIARANVK